MKLTKTQLREIIREEMLNESFDYNQLASFYINHGIKLKYDFKSDSGFPPAVILAAEKMAPEVMKFQSTVESTLKKLESDKMYQLYYRMTQFSFPDFRSTRYVVGDVKFKLSK